MDDLISRETLIDDLCADREEGTFCFTNSQAEAADEIIMYVAKRIKAQPTVDAAPVVHGRWMKGGYACGENEYKCSACGKTEWRTDYRRMKYCMFCGAKMDLEGLDGNE